MYSLMARKTTQAYHYVLRYFREQCVQNIAIQHIMADYEAALRSSVLELFPDQQLHGCWFHFCKNVYKRARTLHLVDQNANPIGQRVVKLAFVASR